MKCGLAFICTIGLLLLFYLLFSYEFLWRDPTWLLFLLYSILAIMVVWSLVATAISDAGSVPFYYGLFECRRGHERKYCIVCHGFKPERTHHCSMCGKCVLNMDHHCPWVNNCIGFYNRKHFLLFLLYIEVALLFMTVMEVLTMLDEIQRVSETNETDIHFALRLLLTLSTLPLLIVLGAFTCYHFHLVFRNVTTLEGMIRKKSGYHAVDDYNVGVYENFTQVFGSNGFYWLLPVQGDGPNGNGMFWPKPTASDVHTSVPNDTPKLY